MTLCKEASWCFDTFLQSKNFQCLNQLLYQNYVLENSKVKNFTENLNLFRLTGLFQKYSGILLKALQSLKAFELW